MAYVIEITEDKLSTLAENAEKMLRYGGKLMHCIDEMQRESEGDRMGERDYRDGMGERGGYRETYGGYGERRGVAGSGRGYRY